MVFSSLLFIYLFFAVDHVRLLLCRNDSKKERGLINCVIDILCMGRTEISDSFAGHGFDQLVFCDLDSSFSQKSGIKTRVPCAWRRPSAGPARIF